MYEAFKQYVPEMATPEMTAQLEAEMDQIAAGEMTKEDVVGDSRKLLHQTYDEIDGSREDFAKQIWAGMDEDKFLGPCMVCEEAGRKREDGSPQPAADHRAARAASGCTAARAGSATTPSRPTPAQVFGRCRGRGYDLWRLEERCSVCGETPAPDACKGFRGRPWKLCLNDDCPSMVEMQREAGRARGREGGEGGGEGQGKGADGKANGAKSAEAKRKPSRRSPGRLRRPGTPQAAQRGPRRPAAAKRQRRPRPKPRPTAVFISLEGIDGSGKSTQAKLLGREPRARDAVLVREPGGTAAAERIRELLADAEVELEPLAELMLFCAARAELVEQVIRPALEARARCRLPIASPTPASPTRAAARGLGVELDERLSDAATEGLAPDLTLLLWIDPEAAAERSEGEDRFESEGLEFQRAVASAYEADRGPPPAVGSSTVDATGSVEEVQARVTEAVEKRGARSLSRAELPIPEALRAGDRAPAAGPRWRWRRRSPPGPRTPICSAARAGRASVPPRAPSPPRSSPAGAEDPDAARRRALLDPSPHPDLVWLRPRGGQHLVEEVREQVIRAAAYRPFEGVRARLRDRGRPRRCARRARTRC